ncbi:MAG: caspase family protein [Sulfurimonadaceae bacterium]|jgi:WD40 repeat protein|nr:caspase family protein [Sulfurimonadaceae bacterium]
MKTNLLLKTLLALLLLSNTLFAEAILSLDTKGHTGMIKDIIVTKSGDIISASDDKTIRVWDSKSGLEKRKILGEIGAGSEGMIYAIALSHDEKYLAVGGFLAKGNGVDDDKVGSIRIYNYSTGKLLKVLKSHTNVVQDLSFSEDSRYLISSSADKTAKIWDAADGFRLLSTLTTHTAQVYAAEIFQKGSRYYALTAGFDNKISLYDIKNQKTLKTHRLGHKLQYLAVSSSHIAVAGDAKSIDIYDLDLRHIKTIQSETEPAGLAYSKDGKYLIAGAGSHPGYVNIYTTTNYTLKTSFKEHRNLTQAVAFLDSTTAISGGGDNSEIYIWDINTAKVKKKIEGVGQTIWSVGIVGESLTWGNKWTQTKGQSEFQKSINLKNFTIESSKLNTHNRIETTNGRYSLSHRAGGEYGRDDAVLDIKKDGTTLASITKDSTSGYSHRSYGWYKNYIISGGMNGELKVYDISGAEVASLVGHTGDVWSIAVDGDRLVSGSSDQTMKVWNLSEVESGNRELQYDEEYINKIMKEYNYSRSEVLQIAKENNIKEIYLDNTQKLHPLLNIFVSKDDEYIAWTKEGFFDASKNAAQFIGYHINQGADKEAKYVSVDKLYDTYYRPDLVLKALNGEDIRSYAKGIDINTILKAGLAPEVKITTSSSTTQTRDITLNLEVCEYDGGGYDNLTLYINGKAIDVISRDRALKLIKPSKTRKECVALNKLISLQSGENHIGFKATNGAGNIESNIDEIIINYKGRSNAKPNLYILSIGIDKYRDGDLLLNYSKADSIAFAKTIKEVAAPLFENIYTYNLLDKDATKSKMLETFSTIGAKTTREDVFILFVAGHGITDTKTGAYFYLPVDFRYKDDESVRIAGFSQDDFKLGLSKIQAMKSLTILDTCNSGSFAEAMASRGVLQKTAINKLTRATGTATLVASSKDQVALEGYKGHGVFTYTLMEALKGKGYGKNNQITIKQLATYVEDVLPERTYEKWGYEQVPQSNIMGNDFPIGVR